MYSPISGSPIGGSSIGGTSISQTPTIPTPPINHTRTLPSTVANPNAPNPSLQRAVVSQVAPNTNTPTSASVLINNRLPARPGFSLPSGMGQFYKAGTTISYATVSSTTLSAGSHTLVPASMGLSNSTIQVGDHLLVDTVASGVQETVAVTSINYSGGTPVSVVATFTHAHDGTYAYPVVVTDLAAPGPFYNDPATNEGGGYVLVNVDTMTVVQLLQDVSLQVPSSDSVLVSTHVHTGVVDANGNPMPQPVDLQAHTQGTVGTGQLPNHLPPAPVIERIYVPGDSDPHASTITPAEIVNGVIQDLAVTTWVSNVPQDHSCNKVGWAIRKTAYNSTPVPVKVYQGAVSSGGTFTGNVTPSTGIAFDPTGTYVPANGNLVVVLTTEAKAAPTGWTAPSGAFNQYVWWKIWNTSTDTVNTLYAGSHFGFTIFEIAAFNASSPISQYLTGTGSNQSYSVGPITPAVANTLGIVQFTTASFGGFYDSSLSGESFDAGFTLDGATSFTYSGPGGPDSGTVISGHSVLTSTSPVTVDLSLPAEWSGQGPGQIGLFLVNPQAAGSPGPWSFFQETYIPNLPNPGTEQELTGAYGQVINGVPYDLGVCYVQTGEVKGPISLFASSYTPGLLNGMQAGLNLIPDPGWTQTTYKPNHWTFPTSGSDLAWYFNLIDDNHTFLSPSTETGQNAFIAGFGLGATTLGHIWAASMPIQVVPGQVYTLWSLVNSVRLTGTGLDGKGMYLAIVPYVAPNSDGSLNFPGTPYAYATVPNGSAGGTTVQVAPWTCPTDGSVTQIRVLLDFNGIHQNSGVENAFFSTPMLQLGTSVTAWNVGSTVDTTGAVRSTQSVTQKVILGLDNTPQTAATSPGMDSSTATPVSGGGAGLYDQRPQGWLRVVQATPPALYQQTAATPTSPLWKQIGGAGYNGTLSDYTFHYQFTTIACELITEGGDHITDESGNRITTEIQPFLLWWVDAGTDGSNIDFYFPDGTTATAPYSGTSTAPNVWGGASSGDIVYIRSYATFNGTSWSISTSLQNAKPTPIQLQPVYAGVNVGLIGSYLAQVGVFGSTDTGTIPGGAGSLYLS